MSADLALSAVVSRTYLGLAPLDINDEVVYHATQTFMGAAVSWQRTQTTSPFMNGAATTDRIMQMVNEQVAIDVYGRTRTNAALSNAQLKVNMDAIVQAFLQDSFTLTITLDGAVYEYQCEASDYQITWQGVMYMAKLGRVTFTMPRQPVALQGVV